jgi:hypothetical protein
MVITKQIILREMRDIVFFTLVSLVQSYLMCPACEGERYLRIVVFTFFMWLLLWKGNALLSGFLSRKISWLHDPVKRFVAGIVVAIGYTVLVVVSIAEVFEYFSSVVLGESYRYTLYGAVIVTILISFFLHARQFLIFWRKASFEKEKFEKESIAAKYESLKNQVSPHFLFNSLNALTNLVYEDPHKAVKFIRQLSDVYRYVLDTREKEMVPLADELKFLDSYLFLQRIRYGSKLDVQIDVVVGRIQVAPLALQMLIENAIKHNVISEEDPLKIRLYSENGFIVIENNLQKKNQIDDSGSAGVGLINIRRRYEFLSNEKVKIREDGKTFAVKLPAIEEVNA